MLDYDALSLRVWKLIGRHGLLTHNNEMKVRRVSQQGKNVSLCCNWNMVSSSIDTFSLDISIPIFSGHVLDSIGKTYSFVAAQAEPKCHHDKTKIHIENCWWKGISSSSLCILEQRCHVCQFHFGIAQSPCDGLHCPTSFGRLG